MAAHLSNNEKQANGLRERTLGVVDIGSNTVHLLIAQTNGRSLKPLVDESEGLRLGGEVDSEGEIRHEKVEALLSTLLRYQAQAGEAGLSALHLLATHAIRTADNREAVCAAVTEATGLPVKILSTEQEAALAFLGADTDCPSVGPQVVVDIGGGSMQIAIGQHGEVWDSVSLPLGAARVATRFLPSDPPTYVEEALLVSYLANIIPPALPLPDSNITGIIGVGGTMRRIPPLLKLKHCNIFPSDGLERLFSTLRNRAAENIASEYDLKVERARLLLPGVILLREVVRGYDYPPLIMSDYGMREGAILSLARHGEI